MKSYPLKFETIYKDKIWGGNKINTVLGKDFGDLPNCGETWEISGVKGNISIVSEGSLKGKELTSLIAEHKGSLVGNKVYEKFGTDFPLLIKFIDANADLSIQVHPDDELAAKRHNSFGKTEMWYVMQADSGSTLISGFNQELDKEKYVRYFEEGKLDEILNKEEVKNDEVYFLPAGRVHTIGKGLLVAEIQQTSDVTYRIYDFDREDAAGNKRELHVEEALDAIDYSFYENYKTSYTDAKNEVVPLVTCEYFQTNKLSLDQKKERDYSQLDSFVILICLAGEGSLSGENMESLRFKIGDSLLVPASVNNLVIHPEGETQLLETYVP